MWARLSGRNFACSFFFFNDTSTTEIYTLSLHDALPIYGLLGVDDLGQGDRPGDGALGLCRTTRTPQKTDREQKQPSEQEHTSPSRMGRREERQIGRAHV